MRMSGVSYRGMHIPFFDEKKLAVWKYQRNRIIQNRMAWYCEMPEEHPAGEDSVNDASSHMKQSSGIVARRVTRSTTVPNC
jgi:hypothetical protein